MALDDVETDREAILRELAKLRYLDRRFNAAITIISVSSLGCILSLLLHGGQISLARASFIIPRLMRRWDRPFVVFSFVFKMVGEAGLEPAKA